MRHWNIFALVVMNLFVRVYAVLSWHLVTFGHRYLFSLLHWHLCTHRVCHNFANRCRCITAVSIMSFSLGLAFPPTSASIAIITMMVTVRCTDVRQVQVLGMVHLGTHLFAHWFALLSIRMDVGRFVVGVTDLFAE